MIFKFTSEEIELALGTVTFKHYPTRPTRSEYFLMGSRPERSVTVPSKRAGFSLSNEELGDVGAAGSDAGDGVADADVALEAHHHRPRISVSLGCC